MDNRKVFYEDTELIGPPIDTPSEQRQTELIDEWTTQALEQATPICKMFLGMREIAK